MKKILSRLVLNYFRALAKLQLKKNPSATIIGITGSAGKTSTRLALYQILRHQGIVKHSSHANSESGISLNILGLRPSSYSLLDWARLIISAPLKLMTNWEHFDYYIVEMGIDGPDEPKNMSYLLSIIRPHVAIVLNAGLTHTAAFDHLVKDQNPARRTTKLIHTIAKEKMQLARSLSRRHVAIVNLDQRDFVPMLSDLSCRLLTFGTGKKASFAIGPVDYRKPGFHFDFTYQGQLYRFDHADIFAEHYRYTFAAAIAAAAAVGVTPTLSLKYLHDFHAPAGRLRLFPGISSTTLIDSTYNASPSAMLSALELLKKQAGRHKKIAVLGDMRELGLSDKLTHKQLADWIIEYADEAILFGPLTRLHTLPVLLSSKFPVHHFDKMADLVKYLKKSLVAHSFILFKSSQNQLFMERAVQSVLADPNDIKHLCRRGAYWDKIRKLTP